jgi:hypothetical protein
MSSGVVVVGLAAALRLVLQRGGRAVLPARRCDSLCFDAARQEAR